MSKTNFASRGGASGAAVEMRKHILYADEHKDTRDMMTWWFDKYGYEVTTADSLAETLPLTRSGNFDLLILAGWFPDGLGFDLCKRIRAFDTRTPIVFLTAYAYQADVQKGMESGAQAYLTKPFDFEVLEQTIEEFIL
jgi:DNA-binding response OmpR family regulator